MSATEDPRVRTDRVARDGGANEDEDRPRDGVARDGAARDGGDAEDLRRLGDGELVARCLEAGRSYDGAFAALYARHADRVFGFLLTLTRSREAAEDALQETFVRVHRSLERFDPRRELAAWLLQIARYVAIDAHRVERKVKRLEEAVGGAARPAPDPVAEGAAAREREALVVDVLAGLDMEDRALLLLRHHQDLTFQAIGEIVDCSARTAQNRVEAAARRFQQALARRRAGRGTSDDR